MKRIGPIEDIIDDNLLRFLSEWRKKQDILHFLFQRGEIVDERMFRKAVEKFNESALQEKGIFIAHSVNGYCVTNDWNLLIQTKNDFFSRGINMIKKARKLNKLMGLMDTIPLDLQKFVNEMEEQTANESSH